MHDLAVDHEQIVGSAVEEQFYVDQLVIVGADVDCQGEKGDYVEDQFGFQVRIEYTYSGGDQFAFVVVGDRQTCDKCIDVEQEQAEAINGKSDP